MKETANRTDIQETEEKVEQHYSPEKLLENILIALKKSGKTTDKIELTDLAPVEEFHFRGREATQELMEVLRPKENSLVLDVGCGIGGTARFLASQYKCKVMGVDLSSEFIYTAEQITQFVGLQDNIEFYKGSATALQFEDNHFDIAISQHINMNIHEKEKYISEVNRVLKKGGKFGIYEIFKTGDREISYPVPWANDKQISYLTTWQNYENLLIKYNFLEFYKKDKTEAGYEWLKELFNKAQAEGIPELTPRLFMGDNATEKFANMLKNVEENKIVVIQAVYIKS